MPKIDPFGMLTVGIPNGFSYATIFRFSFPRHRFDAQS
jgi:hypothetical protein